MSFMESSTSGQPPISEVVRADTEETFFRTPNAPPGLHFEQMTLPGLIGPDFLIPASVSKLFRKFFRRADTPAPR
jgi:hypothetical protein